METVVYTPFTKREHFRYRLFHIAWKRLCLGFKSIKSNEKTFIKYFIEITYNEERIDLKPKIKEQTELNGFNCYVINLS